MLKCKKCDGSGSVVINMVDDTIEEGQCDWCGGSGLVKDILLITHRSCNDGIAAALALHEYSLMNDIKYEVYWAQYGDNIYPNVDGKNVIMADFSYPRDTIISMKKAANSMVVLDHHKTAEKELEGLDYCIFDMNHSGGILLWNYLFPDTTPPLLLRYIEDRDIWKWELENSRQISAAISILDKTNWVSSFYKYMDDDKISELHEIGIVIDNYNIYQINKTISSSKIPVWSIDNNTMFCINNSNLISEMGNALAKISQSGMSAQYFITDDKIVFSFRSIDDVDVSVIARKYGGGGHKNAAGCSFGFDDICMTTLLKTQNLDLAIENSYNQNRLFKMVRSFWL